MKGSDTIEVAIEATRNRSGGAKAHLVGLLGAMDPRELGIKKVHVWSYDELLQQLPTEPWLVKHLPAVVNRSMLAQLWWQANRMSQEIRDANCDILLNTHASSVCWFQPSVSMSRDMLSFEPGEMQRFGLSRMRARLEMLRYVQTATLRRSTGALFLTSYASRVIQQATGPLQNYRIIPHGLGNEFRQVTVDPLWPEGKKEIRCLYVSNIELYKHQWAVIEAVAALRDELDVALTLTLVGSTSNRAAEKVARAVDAFDPERSWVKIRDAVPHGGVPSLLQHADIFVFASTCENMPNTLVEAMATGIPIACSNRGPMPDILQGGGVYFDPEQPPSIAAAIDSLITSQAKRIDVSNAATTIAGEYSWERCAFETWQFLTDTHRIFRASQ